MLPVRLELTLCQLCSYPPCHLSPKVQPFPPHSQQLWVSSESKNGRVSLVMWQRVDFFSLHEAQRQAAATCMQSFAPTASPWVWFSSPSEQAPVGTTVPSPASLGAHGCWNTHPRHLSPITAWVSRGTGKWTPGPSWYGKLGVFTFLLKQTLIYSLISYHEGYGAGEIWLGT